MTRRRGMECYYALLKPTAELGGTIPTSTVILAHPVFDLPKSSRRPALPGLPVEARIRFKALALAYKSSKGNASSLNSRVQSNPRSPAPSLQPATSGHLALHPYEESAAAHLHLSPSPSRHLRNDLPTTISGSVWLSN
ncbi:hypothetical protein AAFF_G00077290 [Aldrovandia affinis]|uniref:Uncharacterized protein n=1 Tax=Aldrovandia affinis TaxID=143900 RepID=A0AAD7RXZ9_9TELE|nr:hypothetical protein AAFF_G00077290 [Aldrovandia affinis]